MNITLLPDDRIYELIYNNGPSLRVEMSRMNYDTYKIYYESKILEEKVRMNTYINHFSHAVPSKKAIDQLKTIVENDIVLEINSQTGLWSNLLYNQGINVIPTTSFNNFPASVFMPLKELYYLDAIKKYKNATALLTVCPKINFTDNTIDNVLNNFSGDVIILICEDSDINQIVANVTGGVKTIMSRLNKLKIPEPRNMNQWLLTDEIRLPQWLNYNYKIYILKKI